MSRHKVTRVRRDPDGRVTAICGPGFGEKSADDVIAELDAGGTIYYVHEAAYQSVLRVADDGETRHLRSTWDEASPNHLPNLPDC